MTRTRWLMATLAVGLVAPAAAAGQACGTSGVAGAAGYVLDRVAGGVQGPQAGADAAFRAGPTLVRADARAVLLDGDAPDPLLIRVRVGYPIDAPGVIAAWGLRLCADGYGGVSRFALGDDAAVVLAGGAGLTTTAGRGTLRPWLSVRALGAFTTGTVLQTQINTGGLAVGGEAGLAVVVGRLSGRLSATRDGFDDGLGVTPFPATSIELAVGYRF